MKENKASSDDRDIFRDTEIRYLGYTNEVGEAFRPLVPRNVVNASYAIAIGYVFCDLFDKTASLVRRGNSTTKEIATTAGDVFLWQMLASVIIPGFTINRITALTRYMLYCSKAPGSYVKIIPTCVGLCSIPIIIKPIDHMVDKLLDMSYRKQW